MSYLHIPPETHRLAKEWVLATFSRHLLSLLKPRLYSCDKTQQDAWFEDATIRKEAFSYLHQMRGKKWENPKSFKSRSRILLPISIKNWKYLKDLNYSHETFLDDFKNPKIEIRLYFDLMKNHNGFFLEDSGKLIIGINAFIGDWKQETLPYFDLEDWYTSISHLQEILIHEMQHLSQWLLNAILTKIGRVPKYKIPGDPGHVKPHHMNDAISSPGYYLKGQEFYPWIENHFRSGKLQQELLEAARQEQISFSEIFYQWATAKSELPEYYPVKSDFLQTLKEHDFKRWQKAVKELYTSCLT